MAGRPKTNIDKVELEKLCAMQCTDDELAHWYGCSTKTIQRLKKTKGYKEIFERGAAKGKVSIKRAQYDSAIKGNVTMLIWLGKVILGQKETIKNELTGENGDPIAVASVNKEAYRRAREEVLKEY
mgnify:CR=1 FL=1